MMSSNIAKRKSEGEGRSTLNNTKVCKDQWKVPSNYFQKSAGFLYTVEQPKLNKKQETVPKFVEPANIS